jgi:hypothetical protein
MRRLAVLVVTLALLAPAAAVARGGGGVPPFPRLPGAWSHAEINVKIKRHYHTLILDRGRIVQVSATQMTLRERDGSVVTIPLTPQTLVVVDGLAAVPGDLQKKMDAQAMRIDGGPAVRVRAST